MTEEEMAAIRARAESEGWGERIMWLVILGEMDADEVTERARVRAGAEPLRGQPIDQWPKIEVRWDLSVAARHHALDGETASDFASRHSRGDWVLLCVPVDELKAAFCHSARRAPDEIWEIGDPSKDARTLFRWSEGKRMTPPLFGIWEGRRSRSRAGITGPLSPTPPGSGASRPTLTGRTWPTSCAWCRAPSRSRMRSSTTPAPGMAAARRPPRRAGAREPGAPLPYHPGLRLRRRPGGASRAADEAPGGASAR
jgi:hypothetical protein